MTGARCRIPDIPLVLALLAAQACGGARPAAGVDAAEPTGTDASPAVAAWPDARSTSRDTALPDVSRNPRPAADAGSPDQRSDFGASASDGASSSQADAEQPPPPPPPISCSAEPPAGAALAAALPIYSGSSCPALRPGETNTIISAGARRSFELLVPRDLEADEHLPVLFLWHWLQGSPAEMIERSNLQHAVDRERFIAVVPHKRGDLDFDIDMGLFDFALGIPWPIVKLPRSRLEHEFGFFDDMLACVGEQLAVNKECVATAGISAGALFSAQLASARSQHLSALVSVSGGVESSGVTNRLLMDWDTAAKRLPALVMWGGPEDKCLGLNFDRASRELERQLRADGHFIVECVHNCQHGEWFEDDNAEGGFEHLLDFFLSHPFWLAAGQSPYSSSGLPSTFPEWCGIGPGGAVERSGSCPDPSCSLPF